MTQRDGMGREVGGGFKMGNTCTPAADSCQYMAKPIQYCKVISLQKKKKSHAGTSLASQWLRLCFQSRGWWFDPWSRTKMSHGTGCVQTNKVQTLSQPACGKHQGLERVPEPQFPSQQRSSSSRQHGWSPTGCKGLN